MNNVYLQVSRHWHDVVDSCRDLWVQLCWKEGLELPSGGTAQECKTQFLKIHHMLASIVYQEPQKISHGLDLNSWAQSHYDMVLHYNRSILLSGNMDEYIILSLCSQYIKKYITSVILCTCMWQGRYLMLLLRLC